MCDKGKPPEGNGEPPSVTGPRRNYGLVRPRRDRRFRCAWCNELREPSEHNGLYEKLTHKPVCAYCED